MLDMLTKGAGGLYLSSCAHSPKHVRAACVKPGMYAADAEMLALLR